MSRGRLYVRLESTEWGLLDGMSGPAPFDGAMISDRYLAPWPTGHRDAGEQPDRLARAVEGAHRPYLVDPDTARLQQPDTAARQSSRAAGRPVAIALGVPLTVAALHAPGAVDALADAAALSQVRAAALAAPYMEVLGPDDPRLAANLELLDATRGLAGERGVVGFLQFLRRPLVRGEALQAGLRMAERADALVLRARALPTGAVNEQQAQAFVALVRGLSRVTRVIVDCAGPAGPPLVAAGADAFSAGTRFFDHVANDLHPAPVGGGGGGPLRAVQTLAGHGSAVPPALTGDADFDNAQLRLWNLERLRAESQRAGQLGLGYSRVLAARSDAQARLWSAALRDADQLAA